MLPFCDVGDVTEVCGSREILQLTIKYLPTSNVKQRIFCLAERLST